MTISHYEGALRPAQHTNFLSGDLDVTGWGAVMAGGDQLHECRLWHLRTNGTAILRVRTWGYSRRNHGENGLRRSNVGCWGWSRRTGGVLRTSADSHQQKSARPIETELRSIKEPRRIGEDFRPGNYVIFQMAEAAPWSIHRRRRGD